MIPEAAVPKARPVNHHHRKRRDPKRWAGALTGGTPAVTAQAPSVVGSPGRGSADLLRTLEDGWRLCAARGAEQGAGAAVGAGWIGAEFATAARSAGCRVTGLEAGDRPLAGLLPAAVAEPTAAWYAKVISVEFALDAPDPVINATPLGMRPDDPLPFSPPGLPAPCVVADVIMKPPATALFTLAATLGHHPPTRAPICPTTNSRSAAPSSAGSWWDRRRPVGWGAGVRTAPTPIQ